MNYNPFLGLQPSTSVHVQPVLHTTQVNSLHSVPVNSLHSVHVHSLHSVHVHSLHSVHVNCYIVYTYI